MENFWKGACAPRERSSPEAGRVPMPGKLPHWWPQGGAEESQETGQNRDLEGRKQRKLHFSVHRQLTDCGPNQMAGTGNQRSPQKPRLTEGRPGEPKEEYPSPLTRRAQGAEGQRAQGAEGSPYKCPQHRGQGQGAKKRSTQAPT